MFTGFIAVIVVILIIAGIMATGTTSASGGVDQTKASKAVSEISALTQGIGFYKTTTDANDYTGISVQALQDAGIVDGNDVYALAADGEYVYDDDTNVTAGTKVIKSRAVDGLAYIAEENAGDHGVYKFHVVAKPGMLSTLKAALDTAYNKKFNGHVASFSNNDTDSNGNPVYDGAVDMTIR